MLLIFSSKFPTPWCPLHPYNLIILFDYSSYYCVTLVFPAFPASSDFRIAMASPGSLHWSRTSCEHLSHLSRPNLLLPLWREWKLLGDLTISLCFFHLFFANFNDLLDFEKRAIHEHSVRTWFAMPNRQWKGASGHKCNWKWVEEMSRLSRQEKWCALMQLQGWIGIPKSLELIGMS